MSTMPVLYLSHGAPPLADDPLWTRQLARWSAELPEPAAILVVSAHWEEAPLTIGATTTQPLVYDFWGFPDRFYEVEYAAPGAPGLAAMVRKLVQSPETPVRDEPARGLDHGAYVPLVEMYPEADVPVLQISMPTLDPAGLLELGRKLAPLRDEGVLIIGSGFFTHNLSGLNMAAGTDVTPPQWSSEFDQWGREALTERDFDALLDFGNKAPAARLAHPRTEHFAPLFVALGASIDRNEHADTTIDGYWYGLSKRSLQFD
ncbi:dioxygenase [Kibdelosporangium phytohabitans]|uniref:Extradiol ring-cleavage dioxygenase n=1 Tax=Kibdelosporangium phytohabitans TaxID=860235 RepID=A0A0N9IFY6_9PSEU|nr:class III extradiol ring-cleavage dioxygenase [Kibdelosporangium phytohabitans]ALG14396.1 extradiol ring-cleavage dioxygenase [Kibdelosporangium phytohabitans]MBE1466566.1 4,5-DOPA dioxygenase extradiol [Kibdelosporangium phytohabitans]